MVLGKGSEGFVSFSCLLVGLDAFLGLEESAAARLIDVFDCCSNFETFSVNHAVTRSLF